jgi:multiple sugar transport system permease protein
MQAQKNKVSVLKQIKKKKHCYLFLAPFFTLFLLFTVIPVLMAMGLSFTSFNIFETPKFVGIKNYVQLFFYDDLFIKSFSNTLTIAIFVGPLGYLLSLVVAWSINELAPVLRTVLVVLFYAPSISGNAYMIWTLMFNGDAYGLLNAWGKKLGFINEPIQWLTDTKYMMICVIVVSLWMSLGTGFLSFVAALQGIDRTLYESAAIDGVHNRWQELWFVTLPSMKPQLLFGAVLAITGAFSVGEVCTNLCGNPSTDYAVHTLLNHMQDYGGTRYEMGYACAISTFLFVLMMGANQLVNKLLRRVGS